MSKQAWAIVPKIAEADRVLRADVSLNGWVREIHPEICFWAWNSGPMEEAKKKPGGRTARRELVSKHFGDSAVDQVREQYPRRDVADDDILDAFAALWSAERILSGEAETLPAEPPLDKFGLRMEIVY